MSANSEEKRRMRRLSLLPRALRSVRKRYIGWVHGDDYFVTRYFGASFLVQRQDMVAREIALKNFERLELENLIGACDRIRPDIFLDIGANNGLYSCVLLKNKLVPRAVLFEPDRRNYIHLRANLQINGLSEVADCRPVAVAAAGGRLHLDPGKASNTGLSKIVDHNETGYAVDAVRIDDIFPLSNSVIAVKMDIEGYELHALAGMGDLLNNNRGVVQIETTETHDEVVEFMSRKGYKKTREFYSDIVFEKA